MPGNLIVLVVAVACATIVGLWFRRYNGHFRGAATAEVPMPGSESSIAVGPAVPEPPASAPTGAARTPAPIVLTAEELGAGLGERATLLQFSSAFCAPCRTTRHVLADVANTVPGVVHIEIDAESHLELVRRLGVMRTPTTFVLDAGGVIISRASGAPAKAAALAALGHVIA